MKKSDKALKEFLKSFTIHNVKDEVIGELKEHATGEFSYFFGNGELICFDANSDEDEPLVIYNTDCYNGIDYVFISNEF